MKYTPLLFFLTSCAATMERSVKPDGASYSYTAVQVGGVGESHGSSGAGQSFNGDKSFIAFCRLAGFYVLGWSQVAQQQAKSAYDSYVAGQITRREAQQSLERIKLSEIKAGTESLKITTAAQQ